MKKIIFILFAVIATTTVSAQTLTQTSDPMRFDLTFDSIQISDSFTQLGLKPSYYMDQAVKARTISLISAGVTGLVAYGSTKLMPDDPSMAVSLGIIGGAVSLVSYVFALVYDHKAADAMRNIKLTGNGVTVSF